MGKKACSKIDLTRYDLDEHWEDDFLEEEWLHCQQDTSLGRKSRSKTGNMTLPLLQTPSNSENDPVRISVWNSRSMLYQVPPKGGLAPLVESVASGNNGILWSIASFLDVRDIASWSCSSSLFNDRILDAVFSGSHIVPCLSPLGLAKLDGKQVRGLALDAALFLKSRGGRNRSLKRVSVKRSYPNDEVYGNMLASRGGNLYYLTPSCQLVHMDLASNRRCVKTIEGCSDIVYATMIQEDGVIVLAMPSRGLRRYVVSMVPFASRFRPWQTELGATAMAGLHGLPPNAIRISLDKRETHVAVLIPGQFVVLHAATGSQLWRLAMDVCEEQALNDMPWWNSWSAWALHKQYIVALTVHNTLLVWDWSISKRLVAMTHVRSGRRLQRVGPCQIAVFDNRVWIIVDSRLYCTGRVFCRLEKNGVLSYPLSIRRLEEIEIFQDNSHPFMKISKNESKLFVACGNQIKIHCSSDSNNPIQALFADGHIQDFVMDSSKLLCCIKGDKKFQIQIIRLDNLDSEHLYCTAFVKNAAVFRNKYDVSQLSLHSMSMTITYALRGLGKVGVEARTFDFDENT